MSMEEEIKQVQDKTVDLETKIQHLEKEIEEMTGRIWKLEEQLGASSNIEDTLRINEIEPWMINHETISQKIEKRILAKLKGLE